MDPTTFSNLFSDEVLKTIFPPSRSGFFFEALYGDAEEGAYTIHLKYRRYDPSEQLLLFDWELRRLPGKCLACSLTYGLPQVFSRHPVIDLPGVIQKLESLLGDGFRFAEWGLGRTQEVSEELHRIPLIVRLERAQGMG